MDTMGIDSNMKICFRPTNQHTPPCRSLNTAVNFDLIMRVVLPCENVLENVCVCV